MKEARTKRGVFFFLPLEAFFIFQSQIQPRSVRWGPICPEFGPLATALLRAEERSSIYRGISIIL